MTTTFVLAAALAYGQAAHGGGATMAVKRTGAGAPIGARVEVRGVRADAFDPKLWQAGTLHLVYNDPAPIVEPMPGKFRNIYAPSIVRERDGWRVFYGAWDGVESGNDRIYSRTTKDFITFEDRRLLIDHGAFVHVCNCSATRLPDGSYHLLATAYPDKDGLNKPAAFTSPDAHTWNGSASYAARMEDIVQVTGHPPYASADINGMNVVLHEDGVDRMYFNDFKHFGTIYRATSRDFHTFALDGPCLAAQMAPNDVKRFDVGGKKWYVMGLHMNGQHLWYSLSNDGMRFGAPQEYARNQSGADKYIVAIGWVVDGQRLLGALYGAGAVPALNENRIFAKWLQKRVVFVSSAGSPIEADAAHGPDAVRFGLPANVPLKGHFDVWADDGKTLLFSGPEVTVRPGEIWTVTR